jgi:hypothetical protein
MLKQRRLIVRVPITTVDSGGREINTSALFLPRYAPNLQLRPGLRLRVSHAEVPALIQDCDEECHHAFIAWLEAFVPNALQPLTPASPGDPLFAVEDCNVNMNSLIRLLKDAGGTVVQSDLKVCTSRMHDQLGWHCV